MLTDSNHKGNCQRCGKISWITDVEQGEIFCRFCGFVFPETIANLSNDSYAEDWFSKARTGGYSSLANYNGLSTVINYADKDATGKSLTTTTKETMKRLRIWDNRTYQNISEKNFRIAFDQLNSIREKLGLSDSIIESAAYLYRKAVKKNLIRGRSIPAIIGACVYAACRSAAIPRNMKEIAEVIDLKKKILAASYRMLLHELDLKMPVTDSVSCVARIANSLDISEKTKRFAIQLIKKAEQLEITAGKNPMCFAATALYLSGILTREVYTQKDLAQVAKITEVSIRNRSKNLWPVAKILN